MALGTQWRTGMAGALGLEYGAIKPTAEMAGIELRPEVFVDLRTMEAEALKTWRKG